MHTKVRDGLGARHLVVGSWIERTRRHLMRVTVVVVTCSGLVACDALGLGSTAEPPTRAGDTIVVGVSGAFAENQLVAEMYAQVLEHAGYAVRRELDLRSRESSQNALESGRIDVKPEYLSSLLLFMDRNAEASEDPAVVAGQLGDLLRSRDITLLTPSPAEDTNQFVANAETADRYDLTTMSSLAPVAGELTLGAPAECPQRAFCLPGLKDVYGIVFNDFQPTDIGGPLTVAALTNNDVQVALMFSTDPRISERGFVPLVDDRQLQDAENITPVIRSGKLNDEIRGLLDAVSASLANEMLTGLVGQIVIDGRDVATVARGFLTDNDLL